MSVGTSAALIGGGIAAAGSVGGALIGKSAAQDATAAQTNAANQSLQIQQQMQDKSIAAEQAMADKAAGLYSQYANQARSDLQPFATNQLNAENQLVGLSDPNNKLFQQERDINTQNIQRQLASQGLLRSKNQSDLLTNLELGLNQQRTGILGGLAGNGAAQTQASISQNQGSGLANIYGGLGGQLASTYQNSAANQGNTLVGLGQAIAQGQIGQANAISGGIQGVGSSFNSALGQVGTLNYLNQLLAKNKTGV